MTARWLSEHRRLLGLTLALAFLSAVALATLGGSSPAQRSGRAGSGPAVLVARRRQLVAEHAQAERLQALTASQSAEISSLKARLQALCHSQRPPHHRR